MSEIDRIEARLSALEDRIAIIDLYSTYAIALDDKDKRLLEASFDDGSFFESANPTVPARTGVEANWKRLMHRHSERPFSERHITTTPIITKKEPDRVEAIAECVIIKRDDGGSIAFEMVGRYEDEIIRKNGRWVFAQRRFVPDT
jgi:hypothetical protein